MPYTLHKLAPGSYDLQLDSDLIGGVCDERAESGNMDGGAAGRCSV